MKRLLSFIAVFCFSLPLLAEQSVTTTVELVKITAQQTSEKGGDEVYFDLAVYPVVDGKRARPVSERVPDYPLSWPSRHLEKIKQVTLWEGEIKADDSVTIIIALIEQDSQPWNTDDLIGNVRLRLKNNNGAVESNWSLPNRVGAPTTISTRHGVVQKFTLVGENSEYEVFLKLNQ